MMYDYTPTEQAELRAADRALTRSTIYTAIGLAVVLAILWTLIVVLVPQRAAGAQGVETIPTYAGLAPFNCDIQRQRPYVSVSSNTAWVESQFTANCHDAAGDAYDVTEVALLGRYEVMYGGSWHIYSRVSNVRVCQCNVAAFRPLRDRCNTQGYSYPMRQRVRARVDGYYYSGGLHSEPEFVRRIVTFYRATDGNILPGTRGCGRYEPLA